MRLLLCSSLLAGFAFSAQAQEAGFGILCNFSKMVKDTGTGVTASDPQSSVALATKSAPEKLMTAKASGTVELTGDDGTRYFLTRLNGDLKAQLVAVFPDGRAVQTQIFDENPLGVISQVGSCEVTE
ncbi:hypothetical protein [Sulfitobacter geojensis]|uniref:Elongation factor P n=1 Tax=Sulfitobacter geojensis TaxID=1342299 RepID=A0AAE3B548_9RHOB|nr:hypothetical protein [Sulfitobacter geojensis]KHA52438.1 hypothetical protein Z947_2741 [Sulfitobacter geojensis]MBM1688203.1 hypothetical protein [Sulfitobacter geojensis]MBM1692270.1 hypothetical protein [Sulfitobacter geojensis]MBM1704436.1 hypothetical protein [Sulfitobacter geojensis]MBM1708494.1 hypothetical protein [Sulfitobacter geojensis]